jgi:hypothetical protein
MKFHRGLEDSHKKKLHNFHSSLDIRVIKSMRMRSAGHVVPKGETRKVYILVRKAE